MHDTTNHWHPIANAAFYNHLQPLIAKTIWDPIYQFALSPIDPNLLNLSPKWVSVKGFTIVYVYTIYCTALVDALFNGFHQIGQTWSALDKVKFAASAWSLPFSVNIFLLLRIFPKPYLLLMLGLHFYSYQAFSTACPICSAASNFC